MSCAARHSPWNVLAIGITSFVCVGLFSMRDSFAGTVTFIDSPVTSSLSMTATNPVTGTRNISVSNTLDGENSNQGHIINDGTFAVNPPVSLGISALGVSAGKVVANSRGGEMWLFAASLMTTYSSPAGGEALLFGENIAEVTASANYLISGPQTVFVVQQSLYGSSFPTSMQVDGRWSVSGDARTESRAPQITGEASRSGYSYWSFDGVPGSAASPLALMSIPQYTQQGGLIDSGTLFEAGYPVGPGVGGIDSYLYLSLPDGGHTFDYTATGSNVASLLVPSTMSTPVIVSFGGHDIELQPGQQLSFLDYAAGGIGEFTLTGVNGSILGGDVGLEFINSGDVFVDANLVAAPEQSSLTLAASCLLIMAGTLVARSASSKVRRSASGLVTHKQP